MDFKMGDMLVKWIRVVCGSASIGAVMLFSYAQASTLSVPTNRSELITTVVDMGEVIVADPETADVFVHGKRHVSVIGKKLGTTTIRLFDTNNKIIRSVDVQVTYDLPAIRRTIQEFLPYENIGVKMINTRLALTGDISGAQASARAIEIAEQFLQSDDNNPTSASAQQRNQQQVVPSEVINLMNIVSGQQVMLRIRVGEVQRNALKQLGVSFQALDVTGSVSSVVGTGSGVSAVTDLANNFGNFDLVDETQAFLGLSYLNSEGNGLSAALQALERDGLIKTLAEPNLVAISGERAQFLAGGEFPIPIAQADGQVTVEFRSFGVGVDFTPFVLSENRIRLEVEPEVSEISEENSVTVNGISVPGFTTRRASTVVELAPGESFMIAGLINDELTSTIDQLPGISEIPILSALFRSTEFRRNETELVIAVTPYIVDPLKSSDVKLPTDDLRPASLMESVFYGALGAITPETQRLSQTPNLEGPIGFMVD